MELKALVKKMYYQLHDICIGASGIREKSEEEGDIRVKRQ